MSIYKAGSHPLAVWVTHLLLLSGTFCAAFADETDTDGDGLPDVWEESGINIFDNDLIDFFPVGADPMRKDVFLEIDYMEGHFPGLDVINHVRHAFENAQVTNPDGSTGITLHIQIDEKIPHQNLTTGQEFGAIRSNYFGTEEERPDPDYPFIENNKYTVETKALVYHYAIFGHQQEFSPNSSGIYYADNTFVVTLGSPGWGVHPLSGHNVGSFDQRAGTLMHELGHSLGLRHGGDEDINCKPNYLSIMSHSRQFTSPIANRPLDYSQSKLNTLNESGLVEPQGISASTPPGLVTVLGPFLQNQTATGVAIDYDQNGHTMGINVPADINYIEGLAECVESPDETLYGFNDWTNLQYQTEAAQQAGGIKSSGLSGNQIYLGNTKSANLTHRFKEPRYHEATIDDVIALRLSTLVNLHTALQQLPDSFYKTFPKDIDTNRFFLDTDPNASRLQELIVTSKNATAAENLKQFKSQFIQRSKSEFADQEIAAKEIIKKLANMILMFEKAI